MKLNPAELHPESLRHLQKGHPWVVKDKYTERFKAKERFLIAEGVRQQNFILISDTAHPKVKARLWQTVEAGQFKAGQDYQGIFIEELRQRLKSAFEKRKEIIKSGARENAFLLFGEGDQVPGLFILYFKGGIVLQSYARLWKKFQKDLVPMIKEILNESGLEPSWIAWQERDLDKDSPLHPVWGKMPEEMTLQEFGVQYLLKFNQGYDLGLYTDMSAIRDGLDINWDGKKVINLYSYTGAWSLYPLKMGAKEVISVDLSSKYLDWLDENINLNPSLLSEDKVHHRMDKDCTKALKELIKTNSKFDIIFCDPPSFSSDGKKTSSALKSYQELIPLFDELLGPGGMAICFINTHSVTRKKFEERMRDYIKGSDLKVIKKLSLEEDCPRLPHFPEGDYLKGILLKKN